MASVKISKRWIDSIAPDARRVTFWDAELPGFGLRLSPNGQKTYVLKYRASGGGRAAPVRMLTLGRHGVVTPEEARALAKTSLAKIRLGQDPAAERTQQRVAARLSELIQRYFKEEVEPKRKGSTAKLYRIFFDKHIEPVFGARLAKDIRPAEVANFHNKLGRTNPTTANRVLVAFSGLFSWAHKVKALPDDIANPCKGIARFREQARERYLTDEELQRLGAALEKAETDGLLWLPRPDRKLKHAPGPENRKVIFGPYPIAAIRLLLLTGMRLREVLHLRWVDIDFQRGLLTLPDSKTGRKFVVLSGPALLLLSELPRSGAFVIAGLTDSKPRADLKKPWERICAEAGLSGLRIHDLRHTNASVGAGLGLGLLVIGKLLGHKSTETTERYAHLAADPLRAAADAIAGKIATELQGAQKTNGNQARVDPPEPARNPAPQKGDTFPAVQPG